MKHFFIPNFIILLKHIKKILKLLLQKIPDKAWQPHFFACRYKCTLMYCLQNINFLIGCRAKKICFLKSISDKNHCTQRILTLINLE